MTECFLVSGGLPSYGLVIMLLLPLLRLVQVDQSQEAASVRGRDRSRSEQSLRSSRLSRPPLPSQHSIVSPIDPLGSSSPCFPLTRHGSDLSVGSCATSGAGTHSSSGHSPPPHAVVIDQETIICAPADLNSLTFMSQEFELPLAGEPEAESVPISLALPGSASSSSLRQGKKPQLFVTPPSDALKPVDLSEPLKGHNSPQANRSGRYFKALVARFSRGQSSPKSPHPRPSPKRSGLPTGKLKENSDIDRKCRDSRQRSFSQFLTLSRDGDEQLYHDGSFGNFTGHPGAFPVQGLTFANVELQRDYGRKIALKVLGLQGHLRSFHLKTTLEREASMLTIDSSSDPSRRRSLSQPHRRSSATSVCSASIVTDFLRSSQPLLGGDKPIYGLVLKDFLRLYGEETDFTKCGYSARDGGFRFAVHGGEGQPSHPQACDPLLVEDPVDVFNNVGRNCFRASLMHRLFFDAHERLKGLAVRHHRRHKVPQGSSTVKQMPSSSDSHSAETIPTEPAPVAETVDRSDEPKIKPLEPVVAEALPTPIPPTSPSPSDKIASVHTDSVTPLHPTAEDTTLPSPSSTSSSSSPPYTLGPNQGVSSPLLRPQGITEGAVVADISRFSAMRSRFERGPAAEKLSPRTLARTLVPSLGGPHKGPLGDQAMPVSVPQDKPARHYSGAATMASRNSGVISDESRHRFKEARALFESMSPRAGADGSSRSQSPRYPSSTSSAAVSSRHTLPPTAGAGVGAGQVGGDPDSSVLSEVFGGRFL